MDTQGTEKRFHSGVTNTNYRYIDDHKTEDNYSGVT